MRVIILLIRFVSLLNECFSFFRAFIGYTIIFVWVRVYFKLAKHLIVRIFIFGFLFRILIGLEKRIPIMTSLFDFLIQKMLKMTTFQC